MTGLRGSLKMNKYDLVIFDVDGTILDTTEGVLSSVRHTIKTMGYKMPDDDVLCTFIGPPIQDSFAKTYGLTGELLQEIAVIFRRHYKDIDLLKAVPYAGIYEVFETLSKRGIASAIATYKREDYAVTLLRHFGFDRYTGIMHGADHENRLKKKDIIEKCIRESGIADKSRAVMIGDTEHDAVGAGLAGIDFIGVTYGFGFHSEGDVAKVQSVGCAGQAVEILSYV